MAALEHVSVTVSDPDATAAMLQAVFGWGVRWSGASKAGGRSVHVGPEGSYVALYAPGPVRERGDYREKGWLNHVGVVVDDLADAEARAIVAGLSPVNHGDYEPGRRFYFNDADGIEWEVVSYG